MAAASLKEPRRRYVGNVLVPLALLAVIAVYFFETLDYPTFEDVGPAAVPHLWMVFTGAFCVFLIAGALLRRGSPDPVAGRVGSVLLAAAWMAIYLVGIQTIGYFLSSFVFLVVAMLGLGYRNAVVIVAVSAGWLIFSYVVFLRVLYIPLPVDSLLRPILG